MFQSSQYIISKEAIKKYRKHFLFLAAHIIMIYYKALKPTIKITIAFVFVVANTLRTADQFCTPSTMNIITPAL